MNKRIYLTDDKRLAVAIRDLLTIDTNLGLITMNYHLPKINAEEKDAVALIQKYCKGNLKELVKKCEFYATLSAAEVNEELDVYKSSILIESTLGNCCVLNKEAEKVLAELRRLDKCKATQAALQEAIKTGKHLLEIF